MTFRYDGFNWLVRLQKGELLMDSLTRLTREQNINGAWVSGIGGALWVEMGPYDLTAKEYKFKRLEQPLEITNLEGDISWADEEPIVHLHGTFADFELRVFGGHIKEVGIGATCEILLHRWSDHRLNRLLDEDIGLNLLDL